ncbi:hypothetical protein CKA32_006626 [Geitlerinema sp. FC II]|nr:hypothetical protein CKA32_006626 [Geitlerinema sp. FC II]
MKSREVSFSVTLNSEEPTKRESGTGNQIFSGVLMTTHLGLLYFYIH